MLLHFNLDCPQRTDALSVASCASLAEFTALQRADPAKYCALCTRTDSDRYAELRNLVEAWQTAYRQNDKAQTKNNPITEVWLKHWLNLCDAQKPLLDWRHR